MTSAKDDARRIPNCDGSSAVEYAVLIVVAIAVLVGMSLYVKHAMSGRWRNMADQFGFGRQYEPGKTVRGQ